MAALPLDDEGKPAARRRLRRAAEIAWRVISQWTVTTLIIAYFIWVIAGAISERLSG